MENDLIRKALVGDANALNMLVDKHKEFAYAVAFRILQDHEDAKDITQDSFLKALENLSKFREEAKFSTWLYRVVHNESLLLLRKRKKESTTTDRVDIQTSLDEEELENNQLSQQKSLNEAIEELPSKERTIIELFYLEEKSVKDIQMITGFSLANVKVILHRTREKLKQKVNHG